MKVSVLIDGGYLQKILKKNNIYIDEIAIHNIVTASIEKKEILHKVLFYDCRPFKFNEDEEPINTIEETTFEKNNQLLDTLAKQEQYVLRLGKLMFIGRDNKGQPLLVQKGVDIRLALDIARIVMVGKIERIIIISGDTDLVPAMKMARTYDIQVVIVNLETLAYELHSNSDFVRNVDIEKLTKKKLLTKIKKTNHSFFSFGTPSEKKTEPSAKQYSIQKNIPKTNSTQKNIPKTNSTQKNIPKTNTIQKNIPKTNTIQKNIPKTNHPTTRNTNNITQNSTDRKINTTNKQRNNRHNKQGTTRNP